MAGQSGGDERFHLCRMWLSRGKERRLPNTRIQPVQQSCCSLWCRLHTVKGSAHTGRELGKSGQESRQEDMINSGTGLQNQMWKVDKGNLPEYEVPWKKVFEELVIAA